MSGVTGTFNVALGDRHRLRRAFSELSFAIASQETAIIAAVETVRHAMELLALDEDWVARVELCLQEALLNAHLHGNHSDGSKEIRVGCLLSANKIELHVEDEGSGFDLERSTRPMQFRSGRGRGLRLIRHLMDPVAVSGNHIVMGLSKE